MIQFRDAIAKVRSGTHLGAKEVAELVNELLDGKASGTNEQTGLVREFLLALHEKGEVAEELVGAAMAMRAHMTPIRTDVGSGVLLDTCGTGGSGTGTFNISTATAIVVSAGGVPVAKHGNRRATSKTGSADVLSELGVKIESDREVVERTLATLNLCFCFAPKLHPAMRHVAEIRRSISVPTMFNLLGPLCNPAGATHQLLGAGRSETQVVLAEALAELGTERAIVVRGEDGQDEVTLDGETTVLEVRPDRTLRRHTWTAATFGLKPAGVDQMQAADPAASASIIRSILNGEQGPCRDIVVANASAAFWLVGRHDCLLSGAEYAADIIDRGMAREQLRRFAEASKA